jgi:hypothetical protein
MTPDTALAFVEKEGVVLVSANGPAPKLVEAIAGEPIKGSWWGHPQGHRIFEVLGAVTESPDVAVCRLVGGKLTVVHRRLWPALVRLADRFDAAQLAQVRQEHTESGRHVNHETAYPGWVPPDVMRQGKAMSEGDALAVLGSWLPKAKSAARKSNVR